jgi:hypothetical protein
VIPDALIVTDATRSIGRAQLRMSAFNTHLSHEGSYDYFLQLPKFVSQFCLE